jgi:hypothetical protein
MFELEIGEAVIDSSGPVQPDRRLKNCSHCAQIAFRVLHLRSEKALREVRLCGAHFIDACARYPEVRRSVGGMRTPV